MITVGRCAGGGVQGGRGWGERGGGGSKRGVTGESGGGGYE